MCTLHPSISELIGGHPLEDDSMTFFAGFTRDGVEGKERASLKPGHSCHMQCFTY